jgi:hypothetical protein
VEDSAGGAVRDYDSPMNFALSALLLTQAAAASDTTGALMTNAGVIRAAGAVDSVFVAKSRDSALIDAGDWTAYLMARLGVKPIPEMGLRVVIDPARLRVRGALRDIPPEARANLASLLAMLDPATPIEAVISLDRAASHAIRFHLDSAFVAGFHIPEAILGPALRVVGDKYPVLANGGRDLFVEIPAGALVQLTPAGVQLVAPPRPPRRRPR